VLTISPLTDEEIAAVVEIENLSFSSPKPESIFREEENKYLVAKEKPLDSASGLARGKGKVVGYIGVEKVLGETHIINMAVHPEYRKQGIGKWLMEAVLNDKDVFFLEVRISNIPPQKLYEKYRFKKVGVRKHYYEDNGEDAYIMRREAR
jgi:ribosomal-protein-alanine N-acetyltransferase